MGVSSRMMAHYRCFIFQRVLSWQGQADCLNLDVHNIGPLLDLAEKKEEQS